MKATTYRALQHVTRHDVHEWTKLSDTLESGLSILRQFRDSYLFRFSNHPYFGNLNSSKICSLIAELEVTSTTVREMLREADERPNSGPQQQDER